MKALVCAFARAALPAAAVQDLLARCCVDPHQLEDLVVGGAGRGLARLSGLPPAVGELAVDRLEGSAMQAVHIAAAQIEAMHAHAVLCVGVGGAASATLLCSDVFASRHDIAPLARVRAFAASGAGAVAAARKALDRAGLTVGDLEVVELDQPWHELHFDPATVHLDATAAVGQAALRLESQRARFALALLHTADGQGIATILERV